MFKTNDFQNKQDQGSLEIHSPTSSISYIETIRTKTKDLVSSNYSSLYSKAVLLENFQKGPTTKEYLLKVQLNRIPIPHPLVN